MNGILPGEDGYSDAALDSNRGEVIFSEVDTDLTGLSRSLQFSGGDRLGFYLETSNGDTFFSFSAANDNNEQVRVSQSGSGFTLAWEDTNVDRLSFGGDFNDLVIDVELQNSLGVNQLVAIDQGEDQRELLDLTQLPGDGTARFTVNREAALDNFVGFYQIDDEQGRIGSLNPGQNGYVAAALGRQVLENLNLRVADGATQNFSGTLPGRSLYAPFIIANGTPEQLLDQDTNNDPEIYFPFIAGNADGADHVRLLGDNVFGFEDLPGGGDNDFNDIVVQINFTLV